MNFFTALLGDEPEVEDTEKKADAKNENAEGGESKEKPIPATQDEIGIQEGGGVFGFFSTLAKKSEEVLSTYQRDLAEFGKELKKETEHVAQATTSALPELPNMLENGAQKTQEKMDAVGHQIEEIGSSFWRGTTQIFHQVKEAVNFEHEEPKAKKGGQGASNYTAAALNRGKYSRYEAQVNMMQRDSGTYCDEPEDAEDYAKWKESFSLESRKADIEALTKENAFMQELQSRIVPLIVEYDTFWTRYFYRLHKLQLAEDARADLVKRASVIEEEELSWDVDEPETPRRTDPKTQAANTSLQDTTPAQDSTEAPPEASTETAQPAAPSEEPAAVPQAENEAAADVSKARIGGPVEHAEEEGAVSDGSLVSTGSEWCVVEKGKEGSSSSEGSPKNAAPGGTASDASREGKGLEKVNEQEVLRVEKEDGKEPAEPAVKKEIAGKSRKDEGEEQDWGAWE